MTLEWDDLGTVRVETIALFFCEPGKTKMKSFGFCLPMTSGVLSVGTAVGENSLQFLILTWPDFEVKLIAESTEVITHAFP